MNELSDQFTRTVVNLWGEAGTTWLARLPTLIEEIERRWELVSEPAFQGLSINYVAPARRRDGMRVVLKLGVPNPELQTEIAALQAYDGQGSVRLLDADADQGALLLERIEPGLSLAALNDDQEATSLAAEVMRQLWRPVPRPDRFPSVARWAADLQELPRYFGGSTGPFPPKLVDTASALFDELISSMGPPVLLHGDLHHMNILFAEGRGWVAIDPKGVIGEREYEAGALIRNPVPHFLDVANPQAKLGRRLDQLAEQLSFDRERLRGWSLAQVVLGAWWAYEEQSDGWWRWIRCAELLDQLGRSRAR